MLDDTLTMIDLFAGAGGLSEGLSEAGFNCLFASEIEPLYAETYKKNHNTTNVLTADIRTINPDNIRKQIGIEKGELDLLAGGPPCQGFSINAPVRSLLDERNHLFKEYLRFVEAFKPKAILIENVPGLVSFENGATLNAILNSLAELGYDATVRILGAAYYGVPQMRWRTIIIGLNSKDVSDNLFPEPLYHAPIKPNFATTFNGKSIVKKPSYSAKSKFTTVRDAISDLPKLKCGEKGAELKTYLCEPSNDYQKWLRISSMGVYNHQASRLSPENQKRLKYIKPGGNWTDIPEELLPKGMKAARKTDHTKRYGRTSPDGLASTILTKCDPHWGAYFHYEQDRTFTVREAARLQSFPDHYVFLGSMVQQYAQVGNAVPPILAKSVGLSLKSALGGE